jgi:RNA polymerase sigma-70 factor (ECF subfamily)
MVREPATTSDGELLARMGGGDALALAALYDRYAGVLLALALRIVRDRTEAEDIVHDAFVLVGERAHHYVAERGSVAAWLVTLARNLSIDRRRRLDRRGAIARDVFAHEPAVREGGPSGPADPEVQVAEASEAARVRRALASLPPSQRATLELSFFAGAVLPGDRRKGEPPSSARSSRARPARYPPCGRPSRRMRAADAAARLNPTIDSA